MRPSSPSQEPLVRAPTTSSRLSPRRRSFLDAEIAKPRHQGPPMCPVDSASAATPHPLTVFSARGPPLSDARDAVSPSSNISPEPRCIPSTEPHRRPAGALPGISKSVAAGLPPPHARRTSPPVRPAPPRRIHARRPPPQVLGRCCSAFCRAEERTLLSLPCLIS
ncbi:translation initiation factor IF-2-like [Triticum dicoccoides]|uniref:translation initiation factor IF-2-like n=1 Tax=Triticum dicoccoides TaxID=85692 RepID=UPI0018916902|nr:translation initiation factor IF-2-like [Triticum dicoccoides]